MVSDAPRLAARAMHIACIEDACLAIGAISEAEGLGEGVTRLMRAASVLGAEAALFASAVREGAMLTSYHYLLACDAEWGHRYVKEEWFLDDPWLAYAMTNTGTACASWIAPSTLKAGEIVRAAALSGFESAIVAPAPSAAGPARVGVLVLGSRKAAHFENCFDARLRMMARALAMEVHEWLSKHLRLELVERCRIGDPDLLLLRLASEGCGSKSIAAAMGTEATTIDCRFQRLNARLGTPNRREAVRLARLYGLV